MSRGNFNNSNNTNPPCRVLHFRNVSSDVEESDLKAVCGRYGSIEKVIMLKPNRQAMVQFDSISTATAFLQSLNGGACRVGPSHCSCYASYSRHAELKADSKNRILLVTFANPLFKTLGEQLLAVVNLDLVHQIFSHYGNVERIVLMSKDSGIQALVQFPTVELAEMVRGVLKDYSFYAGDWGTFKLDLQYSNLKELVIKPNSRSRDYLAPSVAPVTADPAALAASAVPGTAYTTPLAAFQQQQQQQLAAAAAISNPALAVYQAAALQGQFMPTSYAATMAARAQQLTLVQQQQPSTEATTTSSTTTATTTPPKEAQNTTTTPTATATTTQQQTTAESPSSKRSKEEQVSEEDEPLAPAGADGAADSEARRVKRKLTDSPPTLPPQ